MKNTYNQQGRTMIETLSVLGLVGILTIGAIYGFEEMLNKHKANELWNELKSRAMTLSMQNVGKVPYNLNEYSTKVQGATIEFISGDNDTFSMVAKGVPEKVCLEMLKNAPAECMEIASTTITTSADTTTYNTAHAYPGENRDTVCSPLTDTLNLVFTYNSDLGTDSLDDSDSGTSGGNGNNQQGGRITNCSIQNNDTNTCLTCASGYKKTSNGECAVADGCETSLDCPSPQICSGGACYCKEITDCVDIKPSDCTCTTCKTIDHCKTYSMESNADTSWCICTLCDDYYALTSDKKSCVVAQYAIGEYGTWDVLNNKITNNQKICPQGYKWVSYEHLADTANFANDSARAKLFSATGGLCYGWSGQNYFWTSTEYSSSNAWGLHFFGNFGYAGRSNGSYALCVLE